jgi:hypothetical protein
MVIEPQFFIPGDAKAEASEPLSTPINNDPRRMAGIDETDRASPYNPLRITIHNHLAGPRRLGKLKDGSWLLKAHNARADAAQQSPKDYGKYRQPPFDGTFGNQEM